MQTQSLGSLDSLLSMFQMPAGVPIGTLAIGHAGAINAALLAAAILGSEYPVQRGETLLDVEGLRGWRPDIALRDTAGGDRRGGHRDQDNQPWGMGEKEVKGIHQDIYV